MFSLIITIISIALVAALALATIYYGGSAFNKSSAAANAAKIANQTQQLMGAVQLYRADHGAWPETMQDLVTSNYLKTIPVAHLESGAMTTAHAAEQPWTMPVDGNPTFVLADSVDVNTCRETNRKLLGNDGILKQAYAVYRAQCFGEDTGSLTVVVTAEPLRLAQALEAVFPGDEVLTSTPPAPPTGTGGGPGGETGGGSGGTGDGDPWLVQPGTETGTGDPDGNGDDDGTPGGSQVTLPNGCSYPGGYEVECPLVVYRSGDGPWGSNIVNIHALGNGAFTSVPTVTLSMPGVTGVAGYYDPTSYEPAPTPPNNGWGHYDASIGYMVPGVTLYSSDLVEGQTYYGTMTVITNHGTITIPVIFHNREQDIDIGPPPVG